MVPLKGVITSLYGERINPFDGSKDEIHHGIDIAADVGTEVKAIEDGYITEVGNSDSWGTYLRYKTISDKVVIYAHLSEISVREGDKIKAGQVMALSGNTGNSTGPHLHIGIYENGKSIDPLTVMSRNDF